MLPVGTRDAAAEVYLDLDASIQSLEALEGAAYRLIGLGNCRIERVEERFRCTLSLAPEAPRNVDGEILKSHFLNILADENIRLRIAAKTEGVRNLILALAFGAIAYSEGSSGGGSNPVE